MLRFPWLSVWRRFAEPGRGGGLAAEDTEVEIWGGRGSWSLSGRKNLGEEEGSQMAKAVRGYSQIFAERTPSCSCAVCDVGKPLRSTAQQLPELLQG